MTESPVSRETVVEFDVSATAPGLGWPVRFVSPTQPVGWLGLTGGTESGGTESGGTEEAE